MSGDLPLEVSLGQARQDREALCVDQLLVVVDQFEELITLTPEKDRLPFLSRLLAATGTESKITVLLTLRADYYGLAIGLDRGLCDGIQRGLVNVGAMTRDERRRPSRARHGGSGWSSSPAWSIGCSTT